MGRRRRKKTRNIRFRVSPRLFLRIGLALCTLAVLVGLGFALYESKTFKVSEETIHANVRLSKRIKDLMLTESLFTSDSQEVASLLLKEHSEYKNVSIIKQFPRDVIIDVTKRDVFAQIKGKRFYPVDREGVIVESGSIKPFKQLIPIELSISSRDFRKGDRINDSALTRAFEVIEQIMQHNMLRDFSVTLVNVSNPKSIYFLMKSALADTSGEAASELIKVIVSEENIPQKIDILRRLLADELQGKLALVKYIDLRHKKVYVGFKR